MMDALILHQSTRGQLEQFIANPMHAVLLTGPDGIGKSAVAQELAAELLGVSSGGLANYPYYTIVAGAGGAGAGMAISIEAVRGLQKFLQLKTIGNRPLRRAVIVEHAQHMTTEAQNALLKLLEEPPADTLLVLTVDSPRSLLPTIMSRVQALAVHTPSEEQLQPLLAASGKDEATCRQAYFLSGGLPGLLSALLSGDETHPLTSSVGDAKALLQKTPFERLAMVDGLSKQKDSARLLVEALERIAEAMVLQAGSKDSTAHVKQWHRIRKAALLTREALEHSANAKLALSNLFLHL